MPYSRYFHSLYTQQVLLFNQCFRQHLIDVTIGRVDSSLAQEYFLPHLRTGRDPNPVSHRMAPLESWFLAADPNKVSVPARYTNE